MITLDERQSKITAKVTYETTFETSKWVKEVPTLKFKEHWDVKIIPPFGGAIIRFWVICGDKHVSVYLDAYNQLGWMEEPYWEIYDGEETERFLFEEHEEMMERITEILG